MSFLQQDFPLWVSSPFLHLKIRYAMLFNEELELFETDILMTTSDFDGDQDEPDEEMDDEEMDDLDEDEDADMADDDDDLVVEEDEDDEAA